MSSGMQSVKRSMVLKLFFSITFFTSGIIINAVQCVLYFCVRSWNKRLYRKINSYLCTTLYAQLVFIGDWWSGLDVVIYTDKDDFNKYWGKEHAYCVMNHSFEIDWLLTMMIADRIHLLGNTKAYVKKALQYLPVLGWAWKLSDFVMLERSFEKDKNVICKQINELANYPVPILLVFFPEGTRFAPDKHEASEEFARQRNLPELKYHLQPRTRGFVASLPSMRGKVSAIYDITLTFREDDPVKPTVTNLLLGKATTAHVYVKRIPMENLPPSEIQQEKFLRDMFLNKDKLRRSFAQTGDFFATSGVRRVIPFRIKRRNYVFYNMVAWAIAILCPLMYWLIKLLFSGQIFYTFIGLSIIMFFMGLCYMGVGMTKSSKGSSYGAVNSSKKTKVELMD